jgi:LAO/AO transport system kinase
MGLVENILKGDEKSAAKLISQVEEGRPEAYRALSQLLPHTGGAHIIGITGPAGAGKSTIAGRLAVAFADTGRQVGVIATDPTSMHGPGAFLGDRLRMKEAEKKRVFIRSMAHRGYPGGMAKAAAGALYILEGLGKDVIIFESVGAGQSEKGLFQLCDTIITVFTPDYGDEVQLLKAGLMEIGDIVVVNKSDRPGALDAQQDIEMSPSRRTAQADWQVPVLLTRADRGEGIAELIAVIEGHRRYLAESGRREQKKKEKLRLFLMSLLKEEFWQRLEERLKSDILFTDVLDDVNAGKIDPYSAALQWCQTYTFDASGKKAKP